MRLLVSECSVPESAVWVGLGVAFLWVLSSFSLECGVAVQVVILSGREVGVWCLRGFLLSLFGILRADGA